MGLAAALGFVLPVPELPVPSGPESIGTVSFELVDHEREEIYGPNPGGPRRFMAQVWYPGTDPIGLDPVPWSEDWDVVAPSMARSLLLPSWFLNHTEYVESHTYSSLAVAAGTYPVVIYSHGWKGFRTIAINQIETLVSNGYIVIAPDHTLVLWVAPVFVLLTGLGVIFWWKTHPGPDVITSEEHPRRGRRGLVGGLLLGAAFIGVLVVASLSITERGGPNVGVADLEGQDLSEVSNETMEAVIAANLDNPQISSMRLALAERYFGTGDYRAAFPHYLSVADAADATADEVSAALIRLGWMAWDGNRAVDAAIGMFDQALAIDADSTTARYLKGQVLWCGNEDFEGAASLFDEVLASSDLPNDSRAQVEADLDAVGNQERCA